LEIKVFDTRQVMGESAAANVAAKITALLKVQPEVNIIFAAAPSQNEFLAAFITKEIDWDRINAFHMDEYIGLHPDAPQAFGNFLKNRIFSKLPFKSINYLNGNAIDIDEECTRYQNLLTQYPPDIVCLGIGENGHLAFNDPPVADFDDPQLVKQVQLDMACRQQQVNDGCFAAICEVPTHALTLTIPALLSAVYLSVVVPGMAKAQAVYNTLHQPITELCPSTILRKYNDVILYLDKDSSGLLKDENADFSK
jgi:glucosamine-6-phosphate deaminase